MQDLSINKQTQNQYQNMLREGNT